MNISHPGVTKLTYYYQCGVPGCKAEYAEDHHLSYREEAPWPHPPNGWRFLQGIAVCPDHRIEVLSGTDYSGEMWIVEGEDHWSTQESANRAERLRSSRELRELQDHYPAPPDRNNPENLKMRNSGELRPEKVEP